MYKKIGTAELIAIIASAGLATAALAKSEDAGTHAGSRTKTMKVSEQKQKAPAAKEKEMACGKGSCGTDEKGAKAAQDKHGAEKKSEKAAPAKSKSADHKSEKK